MVELKKILLSEPQHPQGKIVENAAEDLVSAAENTGLSWPAFVQYLESINQMDISEATNEIRWLVQALDDFRGQIENVLTDLEEEASVYTP
jgi:hypothetical protein